MNRYTFVLPSENQNALACSPSAQILFIMYNTVTRSEFFAKMKNIDKFSEIKNDEIQKRTQISLSFSLSLSLLVDAL